MAPYTEQQRKKVLRLAREGGGRNAIAKVMGMSATTVSRIAAKEGVNFNRQQMAVATYARNVDLAELRSQITMRMYQRASSILDRLEAGSYSALVRGEGGAEGTETLEYVPARDERDLASSVAQLAAQAAKLESVGNPQAAKIKGLLGELQTSLGL